MYYVFADRLKSITKIYIFYESSYEKSDFVVLLQNIFIVGMLYV